MAEDQGLTQQMMFFSQNPPECDQRCIEGISPSVYVDTTANWHSGEHLAFQSEWANDTELINKMEAMLENGQEIFNTIYTYRCCSSCLPQVKSGDQENRQQIYENTVRILDPEIKKLRDFMYFTQETLESFCNIISQLSKKPTVSDNVLWHILRLLDLLNMLDLLKNMKSSLNNDFSAYKRALGFVNKSQGTAQEEMSQENSQLYIFVANPYIITTNLSNALKGKDGKSPQKIASMRILPLCLQMCDSALSHNLYILPHERHCLLRVMPYCIYLINDMEGEEKKSMLKNKDINYAAYAHWFQRFPVLPFFGDMQNPIDAPIRKLKNFDAKAWNSLVQPDPKIEEKYLLVYSIASIRSEHDKFLETFSQTVNELRFFRQERASAAQLQKKPELLDEPVPLPLGKKITDMALQGLRLLSDWSQRILEQGAWKFHAPNQDKSIDVEEEYARAIQYNYKPEELSALIEVIAMDKGLARLFVGAETSLSPAILTTIHAEIQEFVQFGIEDMLQEATKKKKTTLRSELSTLRSSIVDWLGGFEPLNDKSSKKSKQSGGAGAQHKFPRRKVGPSMVQLELVRSIVNGLMQMKKEISTSNMKMLEDFYIRSAAYPYLMDLSTSVMSCSDIGELWFREFYLELNKKLQFPISMSLPSILCDHVIDGIAQGRNSELVEYALFPLDIYNDAANSALDVLKQQHLFNEIEAEADLCFDQLLYKLSDNVFLYYKKQASLMMTSKPFVARYTTLMGNGDHFHVPKCRHPTLLSQHSVQLLGRSVDLNCLITQRINKKLRANIDHVISRYEASDLSTIVELELLLRTIHLQRDLMSEVLDVDSWDLLFREGNDNASLASFHSRILLHTLFEVSTDFAANYNYNGVTDRFIRSPIVLSEATERYAMPKQNPVFLFGDRATNAAFAPITETYKNIIGVPHFLALIRLIGTDQLPMLITEILKNIDLKLRSVILAYIREIDGGLPQSLKLPQFHYRTEGCYMGVQTTLNSLITYPELQEVFRLFKELGNLLVFILLIDQTLKQYNFQRFTMAAPALGITPENLADTSETRVQKAPLYSVLSAASKYLETMEDSICDVDMAHVIAENAFRVDKLYRPSDIPVSIFRLSLSQLNKMLDEWREEWCNTKTQPENGVLDTEGHAEFHRFWCCLQFVLCMENQPPKGEEADANISVLQNKEMYGDGINWGGCALIHLLGQRYRFDALSLAYRALDIEAAQTHRTKDPAISAFIKNAAFDREYNNLVFETLESYFPAQTQNFDLSVAPPDVFTDHYFTVYSSASGESPAPTPKPPQQQRSTRTLASAATAATAAPAAPAPPEPSFAPPPAPAAPAAPRAPAAPPPPPELPEDDEDEEEEVEEVEEEEVVDEVDEVEEEVEEEEEIIEEEEEIIEEEEEEIIEEVVEEEEEDDEDLPPPPPPPR